VALPERIVSKFAYNVVPACGVISCSGGSATPRHPRGEYGSRRLNIRAARKNHGVSDRKGSSAAEKFRLPLIDTRVRIRRRVAFRHRRCGSRVVAGLAGTRASSEAMPQRLRPLGNKGQSRINFPKSNFVIPAQVRHSRAGSSFPRRREPRIARTTGFPPGRE
jgi:hypothetical protein